MGSMGTYEEQLRSWIETIREPDAQAAARCRRRWDQLAKPLDGLGEFEDLLVKIAGIQGSEDIALEKKAVVVMCGDHGVTAEGVTQTSSATTAAVAAAIAAGTSTVNWMAGRAGASVFAVDVGMDTDAPLEGVICHRVARGTENIAQGPAMRREQAAQAVLAGIKVAQDLASDGYEILAAGEMGIGNTTPAAAITAALTGLPPEEVTGRGAGLSDSGLERKLAAVQQALRNNPVDTGDPLGVLAALGGYEIAGMVGLFLGGAVTATPVVADGAVSLTAAVLALQMEPLTAGYLLLSHVGKEPVSRHLTAMTGMRPVLHARMALGEGTGALLLFPLLDMALALYRRGERFSDIGVVPYRRY